MRYSLVTRVYKKIILSSVNFLSHILNQKKYMALKIRCLSHFGVNVLGAPLYISPTCWFDVTDYSLISLSDSIVISSNVSILIHDYSISRINSALMNSQLIPEVMIKREVVIGENSFIGYGSILMPGTKIGKNCIVGAGSVVRGVIPDNSIVVGNPSKIIGDSLEWGRRKLENVYETIPNKFK